MTTEHTPAQVQAMSRRRRIGLVAVSSVVALAAVDRKSVV